VDQEEVSLLEGLYSLWGWEFSKKLINAKMYDNKAGEINQENKTI
jgi:hypothetical protein